VSFRVSPHVTAFALCLLAVSAACLQARGQAEPSPSASGSLAAFAQPAGWPRISNAVVTTEQLGPGVSYQRWTLTTDAGPLQVSIATVDLRNPSVALAVTTHNGVIIGKGERLSAMADRASAELGINADYFDINESGSPLNIVVIGQRMLHQPDRAAAFTQDANNQVQMGPANWRARVASASGAIRDITLVNDWSASVSLALLTPELGTDSAAGATEIVLAPGGASGQYRIAGIWTNLNQLRQLAPGQLALAAHGADARSLASDFHSGDIITLTVQADPALEGSKVGVGGGPLLLSNGQLAADTAPPAPEETNVRNPVTGAGTSADGNTLWLVVVDGRAPATSIGLTRPQLASLFLTLGATSAMAFDSGGSSEMVVRHVGDEASSVANVPSDGRERSIADGLLVLNTATPGPPVSLVLKAQSGQVLVGSKLAIGARAADANLQPISLRAQDAVFRTDPASIASIAVDGTLTALRPGLVQVSVRFLGAQGTAAVRVVPAVDGLSIVAPAGLAAGASTHLLAKAFTRDGQPIAVDEAGVHWSLVSGGGRVLPDGTFVAGPTAARSVVAAQVGAATATATILSGDHPVMLQSVPRAGTAPGAWHYSARPAGLPGGVDASAAPDGASALRLAYDFSTGGLTRAAYAETSVTLPGEPLALTLDVYGDKNGEWLRAGYANADGNDESLTIARHVDWQGWRTIRVAIPPQAAWPIAWTRIYAVERSKDAREQGSLWFRNLVVFLPGPP
jgi:hypothetical protein